MIHRIYADLPTFKELEFSPGLNVLVADALPASTDRQTRNRAGKSSMVEIIHFLLGSKTPPDSIFRSDDLKDVTLGMELDLGEQFVVVERVGSKFGRVAVQAAPTPDWMPRKKSGAPDSLTQRLWREILGDLWFALDPEEMATQKYTPSYRSLFSYFARRESAGGFMEPVTQSRRQRTWDSQVALTYLLGLDWTIPQSIQRLRDQERALSELRKAANAGAFGSVIGSTAELRTQVNIEERRAERLRRNLADFRVLEEYHQLEQQASKLTHELNELADLNTLDERLLRQMRDAIGEEAPPSDERLADMYEQLGIDLPEVVRSRLEDVKAFHASVVANRRSHLQGEVEEVEQSIAARRRQMDAVDSRRAQIMTILQTHGALENYSALQGELSRVQATAETLRQRFVAAEQLEGGTTELEIEKQKAFRRLQAEYKEREQTLAKAILYFEEISNELYEEAGQLRMEATAGGPRFEVSIQGERSKGVTNMQIFCFDMMLTRLAADRGLGPGFLVHDSHLFDGVDVRQKAHALRVGKQWAESVGFQYIVTMNSDDLPSSETSGFKVDEYILPVRLTDDTEEGGLFGFRFG